MKQLNSGGKTKRTKNAIMQELKSRLKLVQSSRSIETEPRDEFDYYTEEEEVRSKEPQANSESDSDYYSDYSFEEEEEDDEWELEREQLVTATRMLIPVVFRMLGSMVASKFMLRHGHRWITTMFAMVTTWLFKKP